MEFKTEYEFVLPRGYVDSEGVVHREGVMPSPVHATRLYLSTI
jgi:hypothetical protein